MHKYQVGDIVVCKAKWYHKTFNKRGFVEEIVDEPRGKREGRYSIYGLESQNTDVKHLNEGMYFGDHNGIELEPTGGRMDRASLQKYMSENSDDIMLQQDMVLVQKRLEEIMTV